MDTVLKSRIEQRNTYTGIAPVICLIFNLIHCWGNAVFDILFIVGLFDTAEHHFGSRPDIVLTTAGIIDEKNWQKCLDINVVSREWNEHLWFLLTSERV